MGDMLYEQVMEPSYAPCANSANFHQATFEEDHSFIMNYCDERSILSINANVNFHAEMQKCDIVCSNCHRRRTRAQQLNGFRTGHKKFNSSDQLLLFDLSNI